MSPASVGLLVVGLVVLSAGADILIRGASSIAARLGVAPLIVGLTVVAFGTSAPEISVSVQAALRGQGGVALGNVVGSNIFNVLFILGLAAVITPLLVQRQLVRFDVPVLIAISCLPILMGWDGNLGRVQGGILLLLGLAYMAALGIIALHQWTVLPEVPDAEEGGEGRATVLGVLKDLAFVVIGLAGLAFGAGWLVQGATDIASALGMSELVIGLTLVAAGTSLPEVAASVMASIRGQRDLAVGNIVGSNIFNVLFVLGAGSVAAPGGLPVPPGALTFDLPILLLVSVICLPIFFTGWIISRWEGAVFLAYYCIYLTNLLLDAADHDIHNEFGQFVVVYVVPLTVILVILGWWRGAQDEDQQAVPGDAASGSSESPGG